MLVNKWGTPEESKCINFNSRGEEKKVEMDRTCAQNAQHPAQCCIQRICIVCHLDAITIVTKNINFWTYLNSTFTGYVLKSTDIIIIIVDAPEKVLMSSYQHADCGLIKGRLKHALTDPHSICWSNLINTFLDCLQS